jgi:hypothetical protein
MEAEGLDLVALTLPVMLRRHVAWRREQGYERSLSPLSLRGVVGYLDGLGVLTRGEGPVHGTPASATSVHWRSGRQHGAV